MAHLRRIARSRLERWRKSRRHASCITTDLENDNVMRTKRASRWRRVLFQPSTWAVSPVSQAHRRVLLLRDDNGPFPLGWKTASCSHRKTGSSTSEKERRSRKEKITSSYARIMQRSKRRFLQSGAMERREAQVNCLKRKPRIVFGRANFDVVWLRVLCRV